MKVELRRLRLNQGGYTDKGEYFGGGMPLYRYWLELPTTWVCNHRYGCSEPDPVRVINPTYSHFKCPECEQTVWEKKNDVCDEIRAYDREDAKRQIRIKYPEAIFYN